MYNSKGVNVHYEVCVEDVMFSDVMPGVRVGINSTKTYYAKAKRGQCGGSSNKDLNLCPQ